MSLIESKPKFQKELYDTIFDAYMAAHYMPEKVDPDAAIYNADVKSAVEECARNFADNLSKGLADSIYNYILSTQVSITHTLIPGTVLTPVMGAPTPAAGAISILPTEVTLT